MESKQEIDELHAYIRDTFMVKYLPRKITSNSIHKKYKPVIQILKRYKLEFLRFICLKIAFRKNTDEQVTSAKKNRTIVSSDEE